MKEPSTISGAETCAAPCSLREYLLYFLRLGTFGFGGPIALAGHMQRALVDVTTVLTAAVALVVLVKLRRVPEPLVILVAGVFGMVLFRARG